MSTASDCCETSDGSPRDAACPVTATKGTRVRLQTVKAMLKDVSLRRLAPTTYYFCAEPTCDVVYFSQQGECYSKDDLRTIVWQKEPAGRPKRATTGPWGCQRDVQPVSCATAVKSSRPPRARVSAPGPSRV